MILSLVHKFSSTLMLRGLMAVVAVALVRLVPTTTSVSLVPVLVRLIVPLPLLFGLLNKPVVVKNLLRHPVVIGVLLLSVRPVPVVVLVTRAVVRV